MNQEELDLNCAILVADDDFLEHLHEMGFDTIDIGELYIEWQDWCTENVEVSKNFVEPCCMCWCKSCLADECCQARVTHIPSNAWNTYTKVEYK